MRRSATIAFALLVLGILIPVASLAAELCGTVTDRVSGAPIERAGVFVRTRAGMYTGIAAATDATGAFCVSLDPGWYEIEVRVDDYRVAYVRDVYVQGSATDIDIGAAQPPVRLAPPAPNPARESTRFRFTLASPSDVRLSVFDAQGRFVREWGGEGMPAGEHSLTWNLRDSKGRPVGSGVYYVRLEVGGTRLVRRLVLAR